MSERRKSLQHRPDTANIDLSIKNLVKLPRDGESCVHTLEQSLHIFACPN